MTFLVDVNLPRFFSKFQHGDFIFVFNIDQQLADSELWKLALMNDYVIIVLSKVYYNAIHFPTKPLSTLRKMLCSLRVFVGYTSTYC